MQFLFSTAAGVLALVLPIKQRRDKDLAAGGGWGGGGE